MHTTPIGWRVQLGTGVALASMALAAVRVDILNNWEYGQTVSLELATILVLSALGVVAIPTAASILGWSRHMRVTTIVCVILTVWSAINAYSTKQGATILAAQSSQQIYLAAQADEKLARDTLSRIRETGDAGELEKLRATASEQKVKACHKPKSDDCTHGKADEKKLTERLSDAKARDKAQITLAQAKGEAKAGPAEASMVATVIADYFGTDAVKVARVIALILTGLGIAVTQLVALLGGQSASLIASGLHVRLERHEPSEAPEMAAPDIVTQSGAQRIALDRVIALLLNAADGRLVTSGRKLAELTGVSNSTFAAWLAKWQSSGHLEVSREGNKTVIRLGSRKAA